MDKYMLFEILFIAFYVIARIAYYIARKVDERNANSNIKTVKEN